jgi:predicted transcriptional regulator
MRRSKLESYIDILNILAHNGQLKLTYLVAKSNFNCKILVEQLDFLIKNSLVDKKILGKDSADFAITAKGINVLKYFGKINQVFVVEEEKKRMLLS